MWHKPHLINALADLLVLVAAAVLLAAGTVWLVRVPSLPIRQVEFMAALPHVQRGELEQVLPSAMRGNFFSIDLDAVRLALEQLPWVRKVEVKRVWPARLQVYVEEHQAVARWGEGRAELVNSHGEVFAALLPEDEASRLPLLSGPNGTAREVMTRYAEFVELLRPIRRRPEQLVLSSRLAWQLVLDNGLRLEIGGDNPRLPVNQRLARFVEVYPEKVAVLATKPLVVDLRYPNGLAIKLAGERKGK
ncbi:MAG: cell division protein FtsQ/DivIB [Dechloromonas sp.]|nr:cell division protein FtsQ/DivIB [Dechloromonas sp.]